MATALLPIVRLSIPSELILLLQVCRRRLLLRLEQVLIVVRPLLRLSRLKLLLILLLRHCGAVALGIELFRVILEKEVELVDPLLDVVQVPDLLVVEQLVLSDARLLERHDELFALPHDVV